MALASAGSHQELNINSTHGLVASTMPQGPLRLPYFRMGTELRKVENNSAGGFGHEMELCRKYRRLARSGSDG